MMHLLLILAPLAQTLPSRPESPQGLERTVPAVEPTPGIVEEPPVNEPLVNEPLLDGAVPDGAVPGEETLLEEPLPEPWIAPEDDATRQGLLGPWPDDFEPAVGRLEMLPTLDPVTGRILDAGTPMEGELEGPTALPAEPELDPPPATALLPLLPAAEPEPVESQVRPPTPTPQPVAQPVVVLEAAPTAELWPFSPPAGGQSFTRSALWFVIATLAVFLGRRMDGARATLPKRGLLPVMARVIKVVSRIATLIAVLFGSMRLVPDAYFQYFPVVLVAASVAMGWSARDVLHDVLAGVLLVVEHHLVPDMRVEADGRVGTVISVGFRSVSMESDDGQIIRIPNRDFLSTDTRMDKSPYAPVEVVVEAPHGARRRLEEIALASPLVAPGHPPEVFRDPEHPERWVVRARLVHPRWALAFRGAVQDRLEAG
ncbi:MAG: hypothetical protein ACI9VR_004707 [Cognaticolwellia sp.]|jgi:hypothetical protein